jgi:hypothetical protein
MNWEPIKHWMLFIFLLSSIGLGLLNFYGLSLKYGNIYDAYVLLYFVLGIIGLILLMKPVGGE